MCIAVVAAHDDAHRAGINTRGYFIIDFPTETEKDYNKTLELALRINPLIISLNIFMPIAGSKIYEEKYGCEHINVGSHHFYHTYDANVTAKQRRFLLRFYLRPAFLKNLLRNLSADMILYFF